MIRGRILGTLPWYYPKVSRVGLVPRSLMKNGGAEGVNVTELGGARARERQQLLHRPVLSVGLWNEWGRTTCSRPYTPHGKACVEVMRHILLHEEYRRLTKPSLGEGRMPPYTRQRR